jgi:ABC-type nickel/cobalt efflux system permease component RcnA
MRLLFAAFLILLSLSPLALAQTNPLTGRPAPTQAAPPVEAGPLARAWRIVVSVQRDLVERMARHVRAMKEGDSFTGLFVGIGVGLLYGILHTLGPGHGKFAVASYFLSQGATVRRGALMGVQVAVTHVIAAVVLVALADVTVRMIMSDQGAELRLMRLMGFGVLALTGLYMLVMALRAAFTGAAPAHDCGHDHGHHHHHHHGHDHGPHAHRQQGLVAIGAGLAPCTGSIMVMLFALANDVLWAGVVMVAAIAAGMAVTIFALGLLALWGRAQILKRMDAASPRTMWLDRGLHIAGGLLIFLFSAALFVDAL